MSKAISPNSREILSARSTVTGNQEYLTSTNGALNTTATISAAGIATADNQTNGSQKTQIVDAGGEAVTVTGGKLDVNASVDTTGLATSAKQDTGNASLASIDGKITAVNTGAVVVASSALPTGAATAAKQPALGTAGTASADVITVQGIASMTALKVDGSAVTQPISAAALPLPSGAATSALQTQPGVDIGDVTVNNASGAGAVNIQDGGNSITVDGTVAATQSGSWSLAANQSVNVAQMNGVTTSMGVGASGTGTQRVVLANDQGATIVSASGSASSSGNNTIVSAGTNKIKVIAFSLSTSSTTALTVKFQSGAGGTDLWSVILQAPTGVSTGANLATSLPSYLFATASATLLNLNLSSANAVQWSVTYIDQA